MNKEEFLQECKSKGFNSGQLAQINDGLDFGLSIDEVKIYANPDFDVQQMNSIKLAIKNLLSKEEISFVADKKYTGHQMEQIVVGLKDNLTLDKVKEYALPEKKASEMCAMRLEMMKKAIGESPHVFDKEYYDNMVMLAQKQTYQMKTLDSKISKLIENKEGGAGQQVSKQQSEEKDKIIAELQEKIKNQEQIIKALMIPNKKSKEPLFRNTTDLFRKRNPVTIFDLMGNKRFSDTQLQEIRKGYENGLSVDDIVVYAKIKYEDKRMRYMREILEKRGV